MLAIAFTVAHVAGASSMSNTTEAPSFFDARAISEVRRPSYRQARHVDRQDTAVACRTYLVVIVLISAATKFFAVLHKSVQATSAKRLAAS
jgi:hypothetical protein